MKITDLINGKVEYDKFGGQYFWIKEPKGGSQMLAEMRGWGHIQNMFPMTKEGQEAAANGIGLGEVCEALACAVGQIAPNPCYVSGFILIF